jgi:hypothetical protein
MKGPQVLLYLSAKIYIGGRSIMQIYENPGALKEKRLG